MKLRTLSVFFALGISAFAQTNLVRIATTARFDLLGDAGTGSLNAGYFTAGAGSVDRETWLAPDAQNNSYTSAFTITHYSWTRASFHFVPSGSGTVTLSLLGPYQKSSYGLIFRQEVYWDGCSAENATIPNGGFERVENDLPAEWFSYGHGARVLSGPVAPAEGVRYVKVWHESPVLGKFAVKAGVPVTLHLTARAALPEGYREMTRLTDRDDPAHRAAKHFKRGINLAGYLDAPPHTWGGPGFTTNDFAHIRSEGFDHVRIPVAWNYYVGTAPGYVIQPELYAKVDFMVSNALAVGLSALVNIHNWNEFTTNVSGNTAEFYAIWRQIAAHYASYPNGLAFELMNEPNGRDASTEILNEAYAEAIHQIRATNPGRTIFVGPGNWNTISELGNLRLPEDDSNIIVTVHCYDPFYFTHQGAEWPGPQTATRGVFFPGPPATPIVPAAGIGPGATNWFTAYNTYPGEANPSSALAFTSEMQAARQWSEYYGRPLHVGEFGCYTTADPVSRANFHRAMRTTMESLGLGWALWDWNAGFHYWDAQTGAPSPGLHDALFGAKH